MELAWKNSTKRKIQTSNSIAYKRCGCWGLNFTSKTVWINWYLKTLRYTQLVAIPQSEKHICKTATTIEEEKELIEAGFTYITEMDNTKMFRKRKTSFLGSESIQKGPWSSLD